MKRVRLLLCLPLLLSFLGISRTAISGEPDAKGVEFFEKKIRPVLAASCYQCHSEAAQQKSKLKGGLLLDSRTGLTAGGDSGAAITPGSAKDSLLIQALRHQDLKMPPKGKLPDEVVANFEAWINMGAPDPRGGEPVATRSEIDLEAGRKFWSFQPPQKSDPPAVKDTVWPRGAIDRFILAELEAKNLRPVSDAERRVLARRLYFDLIGLPPSPQEVAAFVDDKSQQAVEKLVDRLLDSPQFGERWGRHWLDVARFAESNGNVDNNLFPNAWRYRDYVIAAFNADKPFDRFIVEQLAGDLLPVDSPQQRNEQLIATGFLALTSKPRPQNNPDFAMDLVADQIEVTTTGILGLTVACARCHDHKFDPVPQSDYYALAGFFASSDMLYGTMTRNNKPAGKGESKVHVLVSTDSAAAAAAVDPEEVSRLETRRAELQQQIGPAVIDLKQKKAAAKKKKKGGAVESAPAAEQLSDEQRPALVKELAEIDEQLARLKPAGDGPSAMGVRDLRRAADCALCIRGESTRRGPAVPRGFVSVVTNEPAPKFTSSTSGRRELAEWVTAPRHPLTSRVMANRVWQHLFGRGIVASVDNFGAHGERPSHPALLDYLAVRFVEQGWSVKQLIREIALSRAYGLSSHHDPEAFPRDPDNLLVWRHSPRRLEAEAIRDAALFVSGQLDLGPLPGSLIEKLGSQEVRNDLGTTISRMESHHRSVYLPVVRNNAPATLEPFDPADASLVVGARDTTNVPTQSLFLLNSTFVVEQSKAFAGRLLSEVSGGDAVRIEAAYQRAFARKSTPAELNRAQVFLSEMSQQLGDSKQTTAAAAEATRSRVWSSFCQALLASAEFRFLE